jgi:O-methyltransferase involved in polyketide biosynthesis
MELRVEELRERLGDDNVVDPGGLWYEDDERSDPAEWFAARGWRTESTTASDYLARLGRPVADEVDNRPPWLGTFVTAEVGGSA